MKKVALNCLLAVLMCTLGGFAMAGTTKTTAPSSHHAKSSTTAKHKTTKHCSKKSNCSKHKTTKSKKTKSTKK